MKRDLKTIPILFRTQEAIKKVIESDIKNYGLTLTEFGTMEVLYHKGTMPVSMILEKVLVANSSMSYVLTTLQKKNYIQKNQDQEDKRSYLISLTDKGHETFECMYEAHYKQMRQRLNRLNESEEATLQNLLKKIGKK